VYVADFPGEPFGRRRPKVVAMVAFFHLDSGMR
jgi:hypothetical protein